MQKPHRMMMMMMEDGWCEAAVDVHGGAEFDAGLLRVRG